MQFWKQQEAEVICQRMYSPHKSGVFLFSNEHPSKKKNFFFFLYASFLDFVFLDKQMLAGYVSFQGSNSSPSD